MKKYIPFPIIEFILGKIEAFCKKNNISFSNNDMVTNKDMQPFQDTYPNGTNGMVSVFYNVSEDAYVSNNNTLLINFNIYFKSDIQKCSPEKYYNILFSILDIGFEKDKSRIFTSKIDLLNKVKRDFHLSDDSFLLMRDKILFDNSLYFCISTSSKTTFSYKSTECCLDNCD